MSELSVATWNAHDAFGGGSQTAAHEVIKRLDADVINIPETMGRAAGTELTEELEQRMAELGYVGLVQDYSPYRVVRNIHLMSFWSRIGGGIEPVVYGTRRAFRWTDAAGDISVHGVHLDDLHGHERKRSVEDVLQSLPSLDTPTQVVAGDMNEISPGDRRAVLPRLVGRLINETPSVRFYDDSSRLHRLAGKVIRVSKMAESNALRLLEYEGFHTGDTDTTPTVTNGFFGFRLDHIYADAATELTDVEVDINMTPGISDHYPLKATVRY